MKRKHQSNSTRMNHNEGTRAHLSFNRRFLRIHYLHLYTFARLLYIAFETDPHSFLCVKKNELSAYRSNHIINHQHNHLICLPIHGGTFSILESIDPQIHIHTYQPISTSPQLPPPHYGRPKGAVQQSLPTHPPPRYYGRPRGAVKAHSLGSQRLLKLFKCLAI